ncbi:heliorhodopsin HeR [Patescibacteria group bacterium]|nr:heliorhodopsin HeR [Patescibacteria group bacterium]MBU1673519.1 heliorhodopsin HeR [Patescibacteria group bacterium]MBU1963703.1 heliorhodopsin HeR [Patescibacteria group bacterium]
MPQQNEEKRYKKLRIFNLIMAGFHAIQGALMLVLSNDFSLPVTTNFLKFNPATQALAPETEIAFELPIGLMVAAFLFMSALAHLLISMPGIFQWYERNLKKGINKARWIEYSFSSSLMMVIVCMLVGIYDVVTLMAIFFLNAMMILFGWMMELHNQTTKKTDWTAYIFGCIAGIVPWIGVALYLFGSGEGDNKAPTFVYWIFFSIFIFFNIFAINMILQYKKVGKWKDYLYGEYVYIVLSLVAKSLLAWQVFAGTLRPV